VRDDAERYQRAGVVVLGINPANAKSHERFAQRYRLSAPLLVDTHLAVAERYRAVTTLGPLKFVKRTVVGIDRHGTIIFYKRGIPSTDEILAPFADSRSDATGS
jgi:peroxiredoxin Q/BCP